MGDKTVQTRVFTVREGMTPEDVRKAPNATAMQKKMAAIFDADGVKGYSASEAAVFNATSISEHGKSDVSLWTKYADGTRKETRIKGDISAFKYAPKGKVKKIAYREGDLTKKKVETKPKSTYTPPEVGKAGIAASDTAYYTGTDKIASVGYYTDKAKKNLIHETEYDESGKVKEYTWYDPDSKNKGWSDFTTYNPDGSLKTIGRNTSNNTFTYINYDEKERQSSINTYDVNTGKLSERKSYYDGRFLYTEKYNKDGSMSTTDESHYYDKQKQFKKGNRTVEYDKNNNEIREKQFNPDGELEYTVTPKRNKDGDIVKRDTIWNNQK